MLPVSRLKTSRPCRGRRIPNVLQGSQQARGKGIVGRTGQERTILPRSGTVRLRGHSALNSIRGQGEPSGFAEALRCDRIGTERNCCQTRPKGQAELARPAWCRPWQARGKPDLRKKVSRTGPAASFRSSRALRRQTRIPRTEGSAGRKPLGLEPPLTSGSGTTQEGHRAGPRTRTCPRNPTAAAIDLAAAQAPL